MGFEVEIVALQKAHTHPRGMDEIQPARTRWLQDEPAGKGELRHRASQTFTRHSS